MTDDSTARVAIYLPTGATMTTGQAPGNEDRHRRGAGLRARARWRAAAARRRHPVAPPGAVAPATQAACTQGQTPTITWLLVLQAAGQTINLPAFILPDGRRGDRARSGQDRVLPRPAGHPGRPPAARRSARSSSAPKLTLNGGRSAPSRPASSSTFWTPWQAGNGQINAAGTVASPAARRTRRGDASPPQASGSRRRGRGPGHPGRLGSRRRQGRDLGRREEDRAPQARDGHDEGERHVLAEDAGAGRSSRPAPRRRSAAAASVCAAVTPGLGGVPCVNPTINALRAVDRRRSARSSARGGRRAGPGPRHRYRVTACRRW